MWNTIFFPNTVDQWRVIMPDWQQSHGNVQFQIQILFVHTGTNVINVMMGWGKFKPTPRRYQFQKSRCLMALKEQTKQKEQSSERRLGRRLRSSQMSLWLWDLMEGKLCFCVIIDLNRQGRSIAAVSLLYLKQISRHKANRENHHMLRVMECNKSSWMSGALEPKLIKEKETSSGVRSVSQRCSENSFYWLGYI